MTGPARVGRYRLNGVLGVGSFATAHRAVDERLDDLVAVKILAENHSLNPEVRERFIAEGRALRRIDSPHVVTVHDIGESDRQQPYLVLDLADRGTLADRVRDLRATGWSATTTDLLAVTGHLAPALEAVHAAHLIHRDLSPANVLITTTPTNTSGEGGPGAGRVVAAGERLLLADLGICKDLAVNSGLTVAGGTPGYRAPELDAGPAVIDARADLWSLSALTRWLADGADLPDAFWEVLDRGQAVDPAHRHPDIAAWHHDITTALTPPPPVADPPDPIPHSPTPPPPRRRTRLATAAAAAVLAGGASGALLEHHRHTPPAATSSARVAIEGPTRASVGAPVTFRLRHVGVGSWTWVLPTGRYLADTDTVTITPTSPGTAHLSVTSRDSTGHPLQTEHTLHVTTAP